MKEGKWLVARFYRDELLDYLGNCQRPAVFSENDAREKAANMTAEAINMLQEDTFDGDVLIYHYAAKKMPYIASVDSILNSFEVLDDLDVDEFRIAALSIALELETRASRHSEKHNISLDDLLPYNQT